MFHLGVSSHFHVILNRISPQTWDVSPIYGTLGTGGLITIIKSLSNIKISIYIRKYYRDNIYLTRKHKKQEFIIQTKHVKVCAIFDTSLKSCFLKSEYALHTQLKVIYSSYIFYKASNEEVFWNISQLLPRIYNLKCGVLFI